LLATVESALSRIDTRDTGSELIAWPEHAHQCSWQRNTNNIFYHIFIYWPINWVRTTGTRHHHVAGRLSNNANFALNIW
jgi:hypothetical protein